jgi:hypothetical protein
MIVLEEYKLTKIDHRLGGGVAITELKRQLGPCQSERRGEPAATENRFAHRAINRTP